ncbi:MAG: UDP-glucose/GDP-mannose dehydrogenase family protein [Deltaproteobacteria bacterium]|nr:UDP-glucose/GDP-mannose dehydrogenase family protein [Deltaproteobacteria bacterium]
MDVCVVGSGYVGLVAGACFADSGNDVICVDIDESKIENLNKGIVPIYEPGLEELIKRNVEEKRLTFTTDVKSAVEKSLVCFIAVGTPPGEDGSADLQYVLGVARDIGRNMNGYKVIVDKSTVPVGTADKVREAVAGELKKRGAGYGFGVVSNPEFLKEGAAIDDFMKPDRVVIGVDDGTDAEEIMKELYEPFVRTDNPILIMDVRSAEMTKYAANAKLAVRISFMNEIANLCEKVGADVNSVRKGIGSDSRIGHSFLFAGIGYGGSCFPKDVKALCKTAAENDYDFKILDAVERVNEIQKGVLVEKITNYYCGEKNVKGKTFALWGLSFKPRTDDMREAPSIVIINKLLDMGANIVAHDPVAMGEARHIFNDRIEYRDINYDALEGADALLIVTEWNEFRRPNFDRIKSLMKKPVIFDGRNIYNPREMKKLGFEYFAVGRKV